jgi:two-component system NarL family sensor kinase
MKNLFLLISLFLISGEIYAQRSFSLDDDKKFTDSLEVLAKTSRIDSVRCFNSFLLSDLYFRNKDYEKFDFWRQKGNLTSKKSPFLQAAALYFNASDFLLRKDDPGYEKQLWLSYGQLKKFRNTESYKLQARILFKLSILAQLKDNQSKATQLLIKRAIPLARKASDTVCLSILYKSIGISLMNNGDNLRAKYYFEMVITFLERQQQDYPTRMEDRLETYCLNSENFTQLGEYPNANTNIRKAWAILQPYPNSNMNPLYYDAKASLFLKLGDYDNTIRYSDIGIGHALTHNDRIALINLKICKLQALSSLKRYSAARELVLELQADKKLFLYDRMQSYLELGTLNDLLGDYRNASIAKSKYITLNDSFNLANHKKELARLEATYKNSENEAKIRHLQIENDKTALVAENNRLYYGILLLISFVLMTILILFYLNAKNQKKLNLEKEKNYRQNMTVLTNQKAIEVMQAAIDGEEQERKRIARDLHDGIGSMLSSQKMRLMKMNTDPHSGNKAEITNTIGILSDSIIELRQVAYNLMPEVLSRLGLSDALSDLCFMYRSDKVDINFHANEIGLCIPENIQISIYRIVQELINNALKHAEATEILVDCSQNGNLFFITVEDNGKGFMYPDANHTGQGLKNLHNRVHLLKGLIEIDSSPDHGTVFNIEVTI